MTKPDLPIFRHRPGLDTRLIEEDAFVITRTTIKHLNPTAAIVWLLLYEPLSRHEILEILRKTYPAVAWQRLSADLGKLLAELLQSNLISMAKPKTPRLRKRVKAK